MFTGLWSFNFHTSSKLEAIMYITLTFVILENGFDFRGFISSQTETETWVCQEDVP